MENVKDLLLQLSQRPASLSVIENAKVVSVNKTDHTCKVQLLDIALELDDVKLKSVTGSADDLGFIAYPKRGSVVSICMIDGDPNNLRVMDCTEIESAVLKVGSAIKLKLNATGIVELSFTQLILGGGGFGGLPKIAPLVTKINTIEEKVNEALNTLRTHVHAGSGTPPTPAITIKSLEKTNKADLENKDIQQ